MSSTTGTDLHPRDGLPVLPAPGTLAVSQGEIVEELDENEWPRELDGALLHGQESGVPPVLWDCPPEACSGIDGVCDLGPHLLRSDL